MLFHQQQTPENSLLHKTLSRRKDRVRKFLLRKDISIIRNSYMDFCDHVLAYKH